MTERCTAWQASSNNFSCTEKWKQGFTHRGRGVNTPRTAPLIWFFHYCIMSTIEESSVCMCVCVEINAMSQYPCNISETSHNCQIYYSGISHVRVCVCGGEKNAMSQCLCITVTSLKLLTIVRYIILTSVMSVCVCVWKSMPWSSIRVTSLKLLTTVRYIFCHLSCPCLCEREMPWASMRVTLLKLLTIVRHVLSSVMSACVCVWKRKPWASIRETSLKFLIIVRYIILSFVMSVCVCVCVKENAMSQYPCSISETSHNCQTYHSVICHVRVCVRVCEKNAMS